MDSYLDYYDLERYVFERVGPKFRNTGTISADEFFCIIIWKSNRSKSILAKKLMKKGHGENLECIVRGLCSDLAAACSNRDKLSVLMTQWGFRLPMATAILTVLYPDDFSVYDVRVCASLGDHHYIKNKRDFEVIWNGYQTFLSDVKAKAPAAFSLRDKDRWLWGKSFMEDLNRDIKQGFCKTGIANPRPAAARDSRNTMDIGRTS